MVSDTWVGAAGGYFEENEPNDPKQWQNIIRCACIVRAGYDDAIDIKLQIQLSLDSFKRVLEVDSALDITRLRKSGGVLYAVYGTVGFPDCR